MAYIKVYIHFVWSTKNRQPFLNTLDLRKIVWQHIRDYAERKKIFLDFISGHADHCHCLVSLGVEQTIGEVMCLLKGESSHWINQNQLTDEKFAWQDEYFAVSVSEKLIPSARAYIAKQEEHHKDKNFDFEYDTFIQKYGFQKFKDESESSI